MSTYFAADGSYGSANDLVIIDTSDWTQDEWDVIENALDHERSRLAQELSRWAEPETL